MADQPDYSGSCMIALYPPARIAEALAIDGGLNPEDLHLTIAYTGDAADVDPEALAAAAKALASRPPLAAMISGHARFTGGDQDCIGALADSPELEQLRADARTVLDSHGIGIPSEHGFTPHIAVKYQGTDDPDPVGRLAPIPVTFAAVSAVHGDVRTDFHFHVPEPAEATPPHLDLTRLAIESYGTGWALSGGPMTPRVRAGCQAAVAVAREHADDPGILEVTLHIGKLEGTWAKVFDRREKLAKAQTAKVMAAWRAITSRLGARQAVRLFRANAAQHSGPDGERAGITAALGFLYGVLTSSGYQGLEDAVAGAIQAGQAEGKAGALAVAAEQHPDVPASASFDFSAAYKTFYDQLADLPSLPLTAQAWVQKIIAGNASDLGKALAKLQAEGASEAEMITAVEEITGSADVRAVSLFTDWAISQAMSAATLSLYQSEDANQVDFITAGDSRVCFPAGTPVASPDGTRPIESLQPGQLVVTPQGQRRVVATMARPYMGGLTVIEAEGRAVAATDDHPFMAAGGWRKAGEIKPGDLLKTLGDELAEVGSVVHITLGQPDDPPASPFQLGIPALISGDGDRMPVITVRLKGNAEIGEREVAPPGAVGPVDGLGVTHEWLTALLADEREGHRQPFREIVLTCTSLPIVYDITVEAEHVFYANGLLVHNCAQCSDAEDNSPYPLDQAPIPGLHPNCRCTLASASPLPLSAFTDFLSGVS
jgi:2'-5' RNA ligase